MRATIRRQLGNSLWAARQEIGNTQLCRGVDCLRSNDARPNVFHWTGWHGRIVLLEAWQDPDKLARPSIVSTDPLTLSPPPVKPTPHAIELCTYPPTGQSRRAISLPEFSNHEMPSYRQLTINQRATPRLRLGDLRFGFSSPRDGVHRQRLTRSDNRFQRDTSGRFRANG